MTKDSWRAVARYSAAITFTLAGANHFRSTEFYERIIPPHFPSPKALVYISGVCEMAGGLGLLPRALRRAAGWGLIALLVSVFPANLYMALSPDRFGDVAPKLPRSLFITALWLRLPLQALLIAWVAFAALTHGSKLPIQQPRRV